MEMIGDGYFPANERKCRMCRYNVLVNNERVCKKARGYEPMRPMDEFD